VFLEMAGTLLSDLLAPLVKGNFDGLLGKAAVRHIDDPVAGPDALQVGHAGFQPNGRLFLDWFPRASWSTGRARPARAGGLSCVGDLSGLRHHGKESRCRQRGTERELRSERTY